MECKALAVPVQKQWLGTRSYAVQTLTSWLKALVRFPENLNREFYKRCQFRIVHRCTKVAVKPHCFDERHLHANELPIMWMVLDLHICAIEDVVWAYRKPRDLGHLWNAFYTDLLLGCGAILGGNSSSTRFNQVDQSCNDSWDPPIPGEWNYR